MVGRRWVAGDAIAASLLCAAVVLVFWPVLRNGFVPWDDPAYITANPRLHGLSWQAVRYSFTEFVSGNYHPLTLISLAAEYSLFGLNPAGFHAVSLAWHAANAVLVYFLMRRLGGAVWASVGAALFWSLHPMRVEAVAWVSSQKDLISAGFMLLSAHAYLEGRETGQSRWRTVAVSAFFLALLAKGTALIFPLLLMTLDYASGWKPDRGSTVEKWPYFALSFVFGVIALFARSSFQHVLGEEHFALTEVAFTAIYRLGVYHTGRSVVPLDSGLPPYTHELAMAVLSAALILASCWVLARFYRRNNMLLAGAAFFTVSLVPSLPIAVVGFTADRFSYFPAVGLAMLLAGLGEEIRKRIVSSVSLAVALLAAAVALGSLAFTARSGIEAWREGHALSTRLIDIYDGVKGEEMILSMAYLNRAKANEERGNQKGAEADFKSAAEIAPPDFPVPLEEYENYLVRNRLK